MKATLILLLILTLNSCSAAKDAESAKDTGMTEPSADATIEESVSPVAMENLFYPLLPMAEHLPLDQTFFLFPQSVRTREGAMLFLNNIVYDYSLQEHKYVGVYKTEVPENEHLHLFGSYLYNDTLIKYDRDAIAPNTHVAIYRGEGCYVSIYDNPRYTVIKSKDLITWEPTEVEHNGPILLFERGSKVYALAGSEVLDVSNPDDVSMVEKLSRPALLPDRGVSYAHSPYDRIGVCFVMDNFLFASVYRTIEYGHEEYFLLFNTDDYSFELFRMDIAEISSDPEPHPHKPKAVKRGDGWKYYWFGKKDSYVIDPFLPGGPKIIETLPPVPGLW